MQPSPRPAVASPSDGQPTPELPAARWRVRAVAVAALAASLVYLVWRATATISGAAWWLALPLLALEAHAAASLGVLTFSLWDLNAVHPPELRRTTEHRVAILIPAGVGPLDMLLPTIASAVALRPAHETFVLEDADRPEVSRLALDLGAKTLLVPQSSGTGASLLNHALAAVDADLIAVVEAGWVADPGFLTDTLGYFDDPKLAVVQTPLCSYETATSGRWTARRRSERAFFHRLLQPGRNRWGAALWCGTGSVVRVSALLDIGGVAAATPAPELATTLRLHCRGWRTVHHDAVLTRGLTAVSAGRYRQERIQRGVAAMGVLRGQNPLVMPGLRLGQRLAHTFALLGWFDGWRWLGYLLVPPAVLLTGALPLRVASGSFVFAFTVAFCLQRLAVIELVRGRAPQVPSAVLDLMRMPADLWVTASLVLGWGGNGPAGRRQFSAPPPLLYLLQWSCAATAAFAALSFVGLTPVHYRVEWVAAAAVAWLVTNGVLLTLAVRRAQAERSAGERRACVRFNVALPSLLGDYHCDVVDLSPLGATAVMPASLAREIEIGDVGDLSFDLGGRLALGVEVRSLRLRPNLTLVAGLEFTPGQDRERALLALALFTVRAPLDLVEEEAALVFSR